MVWMCVPSCYVELLYRELLYRGGWHNAGGDIITHIRRVIYIGGSSGHKQYPACMMHLL